MLNEKRIKVKVLDLLVLYYHFYRFIEKHGHLDATRTITEIEAACRHEVRLPVSVVERLLYSCNLLNEEQEFHHPSKISFERFLKRVKTDAHFHKVYNYLEVPEGESRE